MDVNFNWKFNKIYYLKTLTVSLCWLANRPPHTEGKERGGAATPDWAQAGSLRQETHRPAWRPDGRSSHRSPES